MNMLATSYTTATPHRDHSLSRLLEEIAYLEARLIAIGQTGDCAYEKSMARSYRELLSLRRKELCSLNSGEEQGGANTFLAQSANFLQLSS